MGMALLSVLIRTDDSVFPNNSIFGTVLVIASAGRKLFFGMISYLPGLLKMAIKKTRTQ